MAEYALVFTFRDVVSGEGFLAGIEMSGRALMVREGDEDWWMLGVRPAALMVKAQTPAGAYLEFRKAYKGVLFDAAQSASGFEPFRAEVEHLFLERDEREEERWAEASAAAGESGTLESEFEGLTREDSAAHPPALRIDRLDQAQRFTPSQNALDSYALGTSDRTPLH